jgi:hypothetical protein
MYLGVTFRPDILLRHKAAQRSERRRGYAEILADKIGVFKTNRNQQKIVEE